VFGVSKCQEGTVRLAYSPPDGSVCGFFLARESPVLRRRRLSQNRFLGYGVHGSLGRGLAGGLSDG